MSAEPGQKAPYSNDIRHRIVWQRAGMNLPLRKIAYNLNIATGTAYNVYKRFSRTGELDPTKPDRSSTKKLTVYQELLLVGLLLDSPNLYLGQVCQKLLDVTNIQISNSSVC